MRELVRQFNAVYGQGVAQVPDPDLHKKELMNFIERSITASSSNRKTTETISKALLSRVMQGSGFAYVRDKVLKKRFLGNCWKYDCCGEDS
jgi:hypothetical protein